jgi:hypothetical protein
MQTPVTRQEIEQWMDELAREYYDTRDPEIPEDCTYRISRVSSGFEREGLMGTVLLIILILLLVGALPTWPHSSGWGYYPSGGLGLILLIVIILLLMGRI